MFCYLKILLLLSLSLCLLSKEIRVSHTILKQESYYNETSEINQTFIDFLNLKLYNISMSLIHHRYKEEENNIYFTLIWDKNGKNEISLDCNLDYVDKMKCASIDLSDHDFTTFDYDRKIFDYGGIFSYLLILYGLFSLRTGYVYFNLTVLFYCSFGYILLIREIFEFLELNKKLNSEDEKSLLIINIVFYFSLFTCILYGLVCHISKYLKYITFGFIDGLIFAKIIYYFLLRILLLGNRVEKLITSYLTTEIIICLLMMLLFIIAQNKNDIINISNIVLISSYGIIFGINILFGGLPFIPYYILGDGKETKRLKEGDSIEIYSGIFIVSLIYGYYKNNINFKIAIHGKKI